MTDATIWLASSSRPQTACFAAYLGPDGQRGYRVGGPIDVQALFYRAIDGSCSSTSPAPVSALENEVPLSGLAGATLVIE